MRFLIWSNEHNAWWRPNCSGYTQQRSAAGLYDLETAATICRNANVGQDWQDDKPNEMLFPVTEEEADPRKRLTRKPNLDIVIT